MSADHTNPSVVAVEVAELSPRIAPEMVVRGGRGVHDS